MDRLPTFNSVGCLSLELATKIIGFTHMITFGIMFFIFFGYQTVTEIQDSEANILKVTYGIMATIIEENALLISSFFAGCLLFGVRKKNSDLVLSWLLLQVATLLISMFTLPFTLVPRFIKTNYILINLQVIAFIVIKLFSFLVVNSYYLTMSRGNLISEEGTEE